MDPLTITVVLVCLATGFGAGWGLKPDTSEDLLEAQAKSLEVLSDGHVTLLETVQRPVVIDAEIRSTLAEVPVQCRTDAGGDPNTIVCQWATCIQFGQSAAQRPECREIEKIMLASMTGPACPDEDTQE